MMSDIKKHTSEWVAAKELAELINHLASDAAARIDFYSDRAIFASDNDVLVEYIMANKDPIRNMECIFPTLQRYSGRYLLKRENSIIIQKEGINEL